MSWFNRLLVVVPRLMFTVCGLWDTGRGSLYSHLRDRTNLVLKAQTLEPGCLLALWPWLNHLTSMPQFLHQLNGDNNGSTSSKSAGFVMGKSNHEKDTKPDLQRAPQVIIKKTSICPLSYPADFTLSDCDKGDNGAVTKCHGSPKRGLPRR